MTAYAHQIVQLTNQDPRWVEAYMRVEHSTLDHLTPARFAAEVRMAVACIEEGGEDMAERIAQSYGY